MAPTVADASRIVAPAARQRDAQPAVGSTAIGAALQNLDALLDTNEVAAGSWGAELDLGVEPAAAPASHQVRKAVAPAPKAAGAAPKQHKEKKGKEKARVAVAADD
jgi:hypothetical protein